MVAREASVMENGERDRQSECKGRKSASVLNDSQHTQQNLSAAAMYPIKSYIPPHYGPRFTHPRNQQRYIRPETSGAPTSSPRPARVDVKIDTTGCRVIMMCAL